MAFWAPGLRLMRSTVEAKCGWSSGIASANTATAKPWPLPANRTVNIRVLWGVEIEHMHDFDETWVSPCHVVQEHEKLGRKTANINTKKLRFFFIVKAHCSVTYNTAKNIWLLVFHLAMDVIYDFCYIHSPQPNCIRRHYVEGSSSEYCHNVRHEKTRMVVYYAGGERTNVMICLAVSIQYVCVTDRQTDILRQHSPHYAYASRGKNGPKLVSLSYSNCFSSDSHKTATLTQRLIYRGSSVVSRKPLCH